MSNQVPAKIILRSTTKISLNDRFTSIQRNAARLQQQAVPVVRSNMPSLQQVSAANRRLAQQLANRANLNMNAFNQSANGSFGNVNTAGFANVNPGVRVAPFPQPQVGTVQQRSLKQRLGGGNVRARLSLDTVRTGFGNWAQQQGGQNSLTGRPSPRGLTQRGVGGRGGGQRGNAFSRGVRRGARGAPAGRGMPVAARWQGLRGRGSMRGLTNRGRRGALRISRGGRGGGQAPSFRGGRGGRGGGQAPSFRGGRGGRGFAGRGRGNRGRNANSRAVMSQEQLDNQLEEYMSKTKYSLDTELDTYMNDTTC